MTSVLLRGLGHYRELKTNAGIHSVIAFINSRNYGGPLIYPPHIVYPVQIARFQQKFQHFISNPPQYSRLFYEPIANGRIRMEVVFPADIPNRLQEVYDANVGVGLNSFYHLVTKSWLGISKTEATDYLKTKADYQIARSYKKVQNAYILAKTPNERWAMDLIDMGAYPQAVPYHEYEYILTVVDCFSKKVFARPIKAKSAPNVRNAFQDICENETNGTYPHILQSDRGGEFKGSLSTWIRHHNIANPNEAIKHIYTKSYSPTSNGLVERMNGEIRRKIRSGFIRHNDHIWVQHIPDYVKTMNSQVSARRKFSPDELWSEDYNPPPNGNVNFNLMPTDISTDLQIRDVVKANLIRSATKSLERDYPVSMFQVGEYVRIKLATVFTPMRKREKEAKDKKKSPIKYTLNVYRIRSILNNTVIGANHLPVNQIWNIRKPQYSLTLNGLDCVFAGTNVLEWWFGSDLIRVPYPQTPSSVVPATTQRIVFINKL